MTMMILTGASVLGRDFFREISEARSDAFAVPAAVLRGGGLAFGVRTACFRFAEGLSLLRAAGRESLVAVRLVRQVQVSNPPASSVLDLPQKRWRATAVR
jgi:hypothetical protein